MESKGRRALAYIAIVLVAVSAALSLSWSMPVKAQAANPPALTGNLEKDVVAIGKWLESHGVTTVKYTVMTGGDPNSVMRLYGLVEAAEDLNDILAKNGVNVKIVVTGEYNPNPGAEYKNFVSKYALGQNGDFFVNSYVYIAPLAEEGRLLNITKWVEVYKSYFSDFYPAIMKAGWYKGQQYGIPQDTEARPLYIRKDVAACMGWNLDDLAKKVEEGKFTWADVFKKAMEAKEKGCADWGLIHRKGSAHPDLIQFIYAFGGKLYDEKTGKLVVDETAIYKWFETEYEFARAGLLPKDMMSWDWATQIHPTVVGESKAKGGTGNTLFFIGGVWHWTEWQTKAYYLDPKTHQKRPLTAKEVEEKFYYTLFPAGEPGDKPVTLSQPFMWMIAANAGKSNPHYNDPAFRKAYQELAFLIVVKASDPLINALHSVMSSHLPVREKAAALLKDPNWVAKLQKLQIPVHPDVLAKIKPIIQKTANQINIQFLANVTYMLNYTHLTPSHPYYPKLAGIFADAIDKVIRGEMTPAQAVNYVVEKVKADPDLSKSTEIVGSIPTGWKLVKTPATTTTTTKTTTTHTTATSTTSGTATTTTTPTSPTATPKAGGKSRAVVIAIIVIVIIIIIAAAYYMARGG
ncbi:MAG: extracellular solute-binding protein [Desulfurococcales archaeon]|nr:extracellular solute-binding protein [Desulfurococcales archaeon]